MNFASGSWLYLLNAPAQGLINNLWCNWFTLKFRNFCYLKTAQNYHNMQVNVNLNFWWFVKNFLIKTVVNTDISLFFPLSTSVSYDLAEVKWLEICTGWNAALFLPELFFATWANDLLQTGIEKTCLLKSSGFGASTDLGVVDIKGFSDLTKFLWRGGQLHTDCWLAHEAPKLLSVCHWKIAVSVHHVSCSCLQSDCFHTLRFFCTPLQWLWLTWFQHQSSTHV